jgi:hypothetical protein
MNFLFWWECSLAVEPQGLDLPGQFLNFGYLSTDGNLSKLMGEQGRGDKLEWVSTQVVLLLFPSWKKGGRQSSTLVTESLENLE